MVLSVWGQNPPVLWLYITAEGLQGYSLSLSKVNVPWAGLFNLLHHPGRGPPPLLAFSVSAYITSIKWRSGKNPMPMSTLRSGASRGHC